MPYTVNQAMPSHQALDQNVINLLHCEHNLADISQIREMVKLDGFTLNDCDAVTRDN